MAVSWHMDFWEMRNRYFRRLHTGIFNVVTIRQFLLGFRLVKRVTVTHRHARDGKGNKTKELRDDVPHMRLAIDDVGHVE